MGLIERMVNHYQIVKQIPVFTKLNWLEGQKIAQKAILVEYKKGDFICKEGDPADYFYCLVSGRLQSFTTGEQGQKENVDFIHRGMYFGLISVFTGQAHSLTFGAINDSVVLKIDKEDFHEILKAIPSLGVEFSEVLSRRMRRKLKGQNPAFQSTIVSVYSSLKKTGSSTYALNLAKSLRKESKEPVILVNLHPERVEDLPNPVHKDRRVIDFRELVNNPDLIQEVVYKDSEADFLYLSFNPGDDSLTEYIVPFVCDLTDVYSYVVVDLPTGMDDLVFQTLIQSDYIHLVSLDHRKALNLARAVIDRLEVDMKEHFQSQKIKVILRTDKTDEYPSFKEVNRQLDFDVCAILPHLPEEQREKAESTYVLEYQKIVTRVAREVSRTLLGVALGGGAALGIAHIGVIRELEKTNLSVDVITGSSMGALIGSLWAIGLNADEIEEIGMQFEKKLNMLKLVDLSWSFSGFIGGRAIRRWLKKYLGDRTFYSAKIPLKILAYDLMTRQDIVIERGLILDAVCQSIAIPGVINPRVHDGHVIIDGGVLNPVPTNVLTAAGAKKIISVNVLQSPKDINEGLNKSRKILIEKTRKRFLKHPIHYVLFRIGRLFNKVFRPNVMDIIVWTLQATEYLIAEQSGKQADVDIHPDMGDFEWFELHRVSELIACGEKAAQDKMEEIKALIAR